MGTLLLTVIAALALGGSSAIAGPCDPEHLTFVHQADGRIFRPEQVGAGYSATGFRYEVIRGKVDGRAAYISIEMLPRGGGTAAYVSDYEPPVARIHWRNGAAAFTNLDGFLAVLDGPLTGDWRAACR